MGEQQKKYGPADRAEAYAIAARECASVAESELSEAAGRVADDASCGLGFEDGMGVGEWLLEAERHNADAQCAAADATDDAKNAKASEGDGDLRSACSWATAAAQAAFKCHSAALQCLRALEKK